MLSWTRTETSPESWEPGKKDYPQMMAITYSWGWGSIQSKSDHFLEARLLSCRNNNSRLLSRTRAELAIRSLTWPRLSVLSTLIIQPLLSLFFFFCYKKVSVRLLKTYLRSLNSHICSHFWFISLFSPVFFFLWALVLNLDECHLADKRF